MATAPLRPCLTPGCAALTARARCPRHARQVFQQQLPAKARGYDQTWLRFRRDYLRQLVQAGRLPVCGATLPTHPPSAWSQCQAADRYTYTSADGSSLHLDHDPPLAWAERANSRAVCDAKRIVLLCAACHARKTTHEQVEQRTSMPGGMGG
jgi:hypothetical protein